MKTKVVNGVLIFGLLIMSAPVVLMSSALLATSDSDPNSMLWE